MFDLKQELQNFPSIDLIRLEENNVEIPDHIRNSIILYNKAIENLKSKSEDIAIIELKKTIAMNPNFHEAMNLLGLCYAYVHDYPKAVEMFKKVVDAENNSVKALGYLEQLDPGHGYIASTSERKSKGRGKVKLKNEDNKAGKALKGNGGTKLNDARKYVFSFMAGVILVFLISLPFYFSGSESDMLDTGSENISYKSQYDKLNQEYTQLKKDGEAQNAQNQVFKLELDYYKGANKLFAIEKLVNERKYQSAADELMVLKSIGLKNEEREKFDKLYEIALPKAAVNAYYEGNKLLNAKKYQEAISQFEKVKRYGDQWSFMDVLTYNTGLCYKGLGDVMNAVSSFEKVRDHYPKSRYARSAKNRLKELTAAG
ncbi:MAG: tetratricopeptide repeat protein [Clostridia bacterium]|nr:tetratricopeptide repeat protein [Clostridia bacterium]